MARMIDWAGEPFALLIETPEGSYLVPPIVLDEDGQILDEDSATVLAAIVESGIEVSLPVVRGATTATLADIDQRMAHLSRELGVPIGPPKEEGEA